MSLRLEYLKFQPYLTAELVGIFYENIFNIMKYPNVFELTKKYHFRQKSAYPILFFTLNER